jgi:hypothetical protein
VEDKDDRQKTARIPNEHDTQAFSITAARVQLQTQKHHESL